MTDERTVNEWNESDWIDNGDYSPTQLGEYHYHAYEEPNREHVIFSLDDSQDSGIHEMYRGSFAGMTEYLTQLDSRSYQDYIIECNIGQD